jgi:FkbM family methyltransferase
MAKKILAELIAAAPLIFPRPLRQRVLSSKMAGSARGLYRRMLPLDAIQEVDLRGPLEGHRMLINMQIDKAFMYGTFEPELCRLIGEYVNPGYTCMDIGANAGYFSLLFAMCVGNSGRVISFEPLPQIFDVLQRNIALNSYETRVRCECLALADTSGFKEFTYRTEALTGGGSLLATEPAGLSTEITKARVQVMQGDEYDYQRDLLSRVNFIKVDVEGAEGLVLAGLRQTIVDSNPVILIEMHDFSGSTAGRVLPFLKALGYTSDWIDQDHVLARRA